MSDSKKVKAAGKHPAKPIVDPHPPRPVIEAGRHRVRPRLHPNAATAVPHPLRRMTLAAVAAPIVEAHNGAPTDVLLQGFHWTSSQSRNPGWYQIVAQNAAAIQSARFDLVWLPPPSSSVDQEGYMPTSWQTLDSSYGTRAELLAAIAALRPARALADVVVNHRCGLATGGADFGAPAFPLPDQTKAVCRDDESGIGTGDFDTGEHQAAARDLDHTNADVRATIDGYLGDLKTVGFAGWRFDEVRGYAGTFVGAYNDGSAPYLSVGEFWDADRQNVVDWIDATGGKSMAFDFPTRTLLKTAIGQRQFGALKTIDGKPTGVIGWWPAMSVTFLEDHDTGKDHPFPDEFGTGDQVLQGYAYLLTHPGIPCVFWVHYFDYGPDIQAKLKALIAVRKQQGLRRDSVVNIAAADDARYAAIIDDKVAVKIGPGPWDPGPGWAVATDGNDYAVWTRG
jgi:alpha-amylase